MKEEVHYIHLSEVDSTQQYIKEHIKGLESPIPATLVSTNKQLNGIGRKDNHWHDFENSLAFSFSLEPNKELTLSSLEIGALIVNFFGSSAFLKWPNDLLSKRGEKCGGILCHYINPQLLIVGIGINLTNKNHHQVTSKIPIGKLSSPIALDNVQRELPKILYRYILENRMPPEKVIKTWNQKCLHMNKVVRIEDGNLNSQGKFLGIGEKGEAIIQLDTNLKKHYYSGSLFF